LNKQIARRQPAARNSVVLDQSLRSAILGAAILVLSSAALAAALIPALRARSISPLQALRAE
jgi:ABC-type lipoprotein release transport system permease subunit